MQQIWWWYGDDTNDRVRRVERLVQIWHTVSCVLHYISKSRAIFCVCVMVWVCLWSKYVLTCVIYASRIVVMWGPRSMLVVSSYIRIWFFRVCFPIFLVTINALVFLYLKFWVVSLELFIQSFDLQIIHLLWVFLIAWKFLGNFMEGVFLVCKRLYRVCV